MSQPIENEEFAINFTSKLRLFKPETINVNRDVNDLDFGKFLMLNDKKITLRDTLTRSGWIRVRAASVVFSEINVPTGVDTLLLDTLEALPDGDLTINPYDYIDLFYNHVEKIWYVSLKRKEVSVFGDIQGDRIPAYEGTGALLAYRFVTQDGDPGSKSAYLDTTGAFWLGYRDNINGGGVEFAVQNYAFDSVVLFAPTVTSTGSGVHFLVTCYTPDGNGFANDAAATSAGVPTRGIYYNTSIGAFVAKA